MVYFSGEYNFNFVFSGIIFRDISQIKFTSWRANVFAFVFVVFGSRLCFTLKALSSNEVCRMMMMMMIRATHAPIVLVRFLSAFHVLHFYIAHCVLFN